MNDLTLFAVCSAGSFINANNNGMCEVCAPDTFSSTPDSSQCEACQGLATTQGQSGQTTCGKTISCLDLLWQEKVRCIFSLDRDNLVREIGHCTIQTTTIHLTEFRQDNINLSC